jgi:uncharacterized repeat protein (TIGR01451 family)
MKISYLFGLSLLLFFSGANAISQEQGHLNVTTLAQMEEVSVSDDGQRQTRLVPADTVVPGDVVIYTTTVENISDEAADDVVVTNPVPEHLSYVAGSAFGPGMVIEFSVDGGVNYAAADELTVEEDGQARAATAEDFTHIRFVMQSGLAAGAQSIARFKARLN